MGKGNYNEDLAKCCDLRNISKHHVTFYVKSLMIFFFEYFFVEEPASETLSTSHGRQLGSRERNLKNVFTRTRCLHGGDYSKRLNASCLQQEGGQGLPAPHWRCSRTKRAERFTVAQCETESGAVSKQDVQIFNSF